MQPVYRSIRFKEIRYLEIKELRDALAEERHNDNLSLPDTVAEAIKFFKEHRPQTDTE